MVLAIIIKLNKFINNSVIENIKQDTHFTTNQQYPPVLKVSSYIAIILMSNVPIS